MAMVELQVRWDEVGLANFFEETTHTGLLLLAGLNARKLPTPQGKMIRSCFVR